MVAGVGLPDQVLEANHRPRSTADIVQGLHDMYDLGEPRSVWSLHEIETAIDFFYRGWINVGQGTAEDL